MNETDPSGLSILNLVLTLGAGLLGLLIGAGVLILRQNHHPTLPLQPEIITPTCPGCGQQKKLTVHGTSVCETQSCPFSTSFMTSNR